MNEYNMEEMKQVIGHNIVALRRGAGLKQSELAARLNYSDKAVSKWECGDAVPDILTLVRISEMFGVTLDWLTKREHEVDMKTATRSKTRRHVVIMMLSAMVVWMVAAPAFVVTAGILDSLAEAWLAFVYAIPASAIVVLVLSAVWKHRFTKYASITVLIWGVIVSVYLTLVVCFPTVFLMRWILFILGIPLQACVLLWPLMSPTLRFFRKPPVIKDT